MSGFAVDFVRIPKFPSQEEEAEARAWAREQLRLPDFEKVVAAAFMEVPEIARQLERPLNWADALRRGARKYIIDRWAFEDAAGEC